jgi:hypothetical protein
MNLKLPLAALAFLGAAQAGATEFNCTRPTLAVGEAGANPVVSISVSFNSGAWTVTHTALDGTRYVRNDQYEMADRPQPPSSDRAIWRGRLKTNPKLTMVGQLTLAGDASSYSEVLYDGARGNKVILDATAPCRIAAAASSGDDSVPLIVGAAQVKATVTLGSFDAKMVIDTGASDMQIVAGLANALVDKGEAAPGPDKQYLLADGSGGTRPTVVIHAMRLGTHVLHDVPASVSKDGVSMLLPFPVLNQIGKFTIDTVSGKLVFG